MIRDSYVAKAISTKYWMPFEDYLKIIADSLEGKIDDGDIIAVSEKALSTAKGRIVNESEVQPGIMARLLANYWMRIVWGIFLGRVCGLKEKNIQRLRAYPAKEGSAHKQVALWYGGVSESLLWGSEGGIDASNLPYSYVSLPLEEPYLVAEEIRSYLEKKLGKKVVVIIVDTDKTYSLGTFHFTHRSNVLKGIYTLGFLAYVAGRVFRMKRRSTPLAIAGSEINVDVALDLAEATHKCRGSGAGRTVWDMAEKFGVDATKVSWGMLRSLRHKPIVIFKHDKISRR